MFRSLWISLTPKPPRAAPSDPFPRTVLELTPFVSDLDRSMAFFSSLGLNVEPWPGAENTTANVTLLCPNNTPPPTRCVFGFQVTDLAAVAETLDRNGFGWECPGPNRLHTRDQEGNRVHVLALE